MQKALDPNAAFSINCEFKWDLNRGDGRADQRRRNRICSLLRISRFFSAGHRESYIIPFGHSI